MNEYKLVPSGKFFNVVRVDPRPGRSFPRWVARFMTEYDALIFIAAKQQAERDLVEAHRR